MLLSQLLANLGDPNKGGPQALMALGQALVAAGSPQPVGSSRLGAASPYLQQASQAPLLAQQQARQQQLQKMQMEQAQMQLQAERNKQSALGMLTGSQPGMASTPLPGNQEILWNQDKRPGVLTDAGTLTPYGAGILGMLDPAALAKQLTTPPNVDFKTIQSGDQNVTYKTDSRGNMVPVAQGPRWEPGTLRGNTPADIQVWEYYNKLSPDDQKRFLETKRAQQWLNLGGTMVNPSVAPPIETPGLYAKTLPPQEQPAIKGAQAEAAAAGKTAGEARAQANVDLPKVITQSTDTKRLIDDLVNDPGLDYLTGPKAMLGVYKIPGTAAFNAAARLDQLVGKQFLEAYQTLKGGGQITEIEGEKATNAMSRMRIGVTKEEFKKAAQELKDVFDASIRRMQQRAGGQTPSAQSALPTDEELLKMYGGR